MLEALEFHTRNCFHLARGQWTGGGVSGLAAGVSGLVASALHTSHLTPFKALYGLFRGFSGLLKGSLGRPS